MTVFMGLGLAFPIVATIIYIILKLNRKVEK
jgi:hypothetical protein